MEKRFHLLSILFIVFVIISPILASAQTAEVVGTIENLSIKMDGVAWDGKNVWVITYQSSPLEWRIAKLDSKGDILTSFQVPVDSLDDIHNFGMSNITSDRKTIWANHWNEGIIYRFNKQGKVLNKFRVPSVNQLIPVGIAWDGTYIWVLHWSDRNLYKLDKNGKEIDKISLRKLTPPPDMGLAWDGKYFWVGSKGANRVTRITPDGQPTGFIRGPKKGGGIRDIDWDGDHLLLVYQQDSTIYKLKIQD
jgi:sugar lactone lactonase YvrE